MGDAGTALFLCDLEDRLCDHRASQRRAQRVALVRRVRANALETEIGEFCSRVDDVVLETERFGGFFSFVEFRSRLANVDGDADHVVVSVFLLEQRDTDSRVQAARKRKCHAGHIVLE